MDVGVAEGGAPEALSALDLARMTWATVESTRYPELSLGRGAFVLVKGPPGHGKSSLVAGMLDGVPAPVLLLSVEEPPGPALASRLLRGGVKRQDSERYLHPNLGHARRPGGAARRAERARRGAPSTQRRRASEKP